MGGEAVPFAVGVGVGTGTGTGTGLGFGGAEEVIGAERDGGRAERKGRGSARGRGCLGHLKRPAVAVAGKRVEKREGFPEFLCGGVAVEWVEVVDAGVERGRADRGRRRRAGGEGDGHGYRVRLERGVVEDEDRPRKR